jgi:RNA polymerase sigma-70 factor (ECF subfamily)
MDLLAPDTPRWRLSAREGDYRLFCAEFYPRLARYCWRLVRNEELAREITQEAFARLLARRLTVRDPEPYLFFIAANLVRDLQRGSRHAPVPLLTDDDSHFGDRAARRASHDALHLAVNLLPRRYRELILLHYFADLPVNEIALAVHRPVGTVKRQLAEARALLATSVERA